MFLYITILLFSFQYIICKIPNPLFPLCILYKTMIRIIVILHSQSRTLAYLMVFLENNRTRISQTKNVEIDR